MKKISLATKIFIGFVLGIIIGLIFKEQASVLKPIGDIFLRVIKMIVVPLIFFSITLGVAGMGDISKVRRIGTKTLLYYIVTTLIAASFGLVIAHLIKPGAGFNMDIISSGEVAQSNAEMPTIGETLVNMFPDNPVQAMAETELLQIIVFSLFLGISIIMIGEKGKPVLKFIESSSEIMQKMTAIVMEFSPIGVFALMADTIGKYGLSIFGPFGKFILTDYLGLITIILILYNLMVKFIAKIPLNVFYKHIVKIWAVTLSTASSSGSLPITLEKTTEDFKVNNDLASFTLPLGATVNMNGAGLYYGALVVFVSQIYGIDLTIGQQITVILTTTLLSVGSAGIPGSGIVMSIILLKTMGLPMEIMGIIAGIYRIIDMGHTTLNVTGDVVSTLCIARSENMFIEEPA